MAGPDATPPPTRRPTPPLLPGLARGGLRVGVAVFALLAAGTLYLLAVRVGVAAGLWRPAAGFTTPLYQVALLSHTGLGLLLLVPLTLVLVVHLPRVWRRRRRATMASGAGIVALAIVSTLTGLWITGRSTGGPEAWVWWLHALAGGGVVASYLAHRRAGLRPPSRQAMNRLLAWCSAGAVALVVADLTIHVDVVPDPAPLSGSPGSAAAGRVAPASPFFPSPATTVSGGRASVSAIVGTPGPEVSARVREEAQRAGFATTDLVGAETCVGCHPDVTRQWAASAHRFSSFNNPFYEASLGPLRRDDASNRWVDEHLAAMEGAVAGPGVARSKWCAGCHDPALLLTGAMDAAVDRASTAAQAGLTCLSCHGVAHVRDLTGNGNYVLDDRRETVYLFADAPAGSRARALHDAVLKARPAAHRDRFMRPLLKRAEFCATCHKVSLTEPLNGYRWLRGQNEFDAWQNSGVAWGAARTFYLPEAPRVCQDCHMPPEAAPEGDLAADGGMVRSHRFAAANTALPFLRGDTAMVRRVESFLQSEKMRVDVFALEAGARRVMALDRAAARVQAGTPVRVGVVVRNLGVGHTFPGGTNDSNEGWLEVTVRTDDGAVVAASGTLDAAGHLEGGAHRFGALFVDEEGREAHARNAQDFRAAVYANVVGPGSARLAHYVLDVPSLPEGTRLHVTARLLWRKFTRAFTEFAFQENPAGFAAFGAPPDLPVTLVAADSAVFAVGRGFEAQEEVSGPDDWVRFNDYGIALLAEGDARGAREAFHAAEALRPDVVDGPLNLARVAFRDGDLDEAYAHLRRAEDLAPGNPRAAWVWGVALLEDGRYVAAEAAFLRVLERFPRDRAAWRQLGRTRFLDGRFEAALEAFEAVLGIDPEDRVAHYHRMLALRALGREAEAALAEEAYRTYNLDPLAPEWTRPVRLADPGANALAQRVRVHLLEPPR